MRVARDYRIFGAPGVHPGLLLVFAVAGCASPPSDPATAKRPTPADPKVATPDYWWTKPDVAEVPAPEFQPLWDACRAEVRGRFFPVDREDYRDGLLSTEPVVSKQIFEPWRTDAVTLHDEAESTLATIRRTIRWKLTKRPDGTFVAAAERRLTAITQYHQAFAGPRPFADAADESGNAVVAKAVEDYWYAVRRDDALERDLAAAVARRLAAGGPATRRSSE